MPASESRYSAKHDFGGRSTRTYTRKEIAAARRQGLARGSIEKDTVGGPIFWAGGTFHLHKAEADLRDMEVIVEALRREWENLGVSDASE